MIDSAALSAECQLCCGLQWMPWVAPCPRRHHRRGVDRCPASGYYLLLIGARDVIGPRSGTQCGRRRPPDSYAPERIEMAGWRQRHCGKPLAIKVAAEAVRNRNRRSSVPAMRRWRSTPAAVQTPRVSIRRRHAAINPTRQSRRAARLRRDRQCRPQHLVSSP